MIPTPTRTRHPRIAAAALCLAASIVPSAACAQEDWSIKTFDVRIDLAKDGTFEVIEKIVARFDVPKHGLFREIPVRFNARGNLYDIRLHLLSVTDANDVAYRRAVSDVENRVVIKIGDPNVTLTGEQVYVIRYRVDRAVIWKGDRAELLWNATGNSWKVPVGEAKVTLVLPEGVDAKAVDWKAFTGSLGSTESDVKLGSDGGVLTCEVTRPFRAGEAVSVEARFPAGAIERASLLSRIGWWMADNFAYGLIPLGLGACFLTWFFKGRDAEGMGSVVVRYEPPEGLGPAEVGTLIDEKADQRDVSSTIVDLAVRGFLTIEEQKEKGLFGIGSSTDYTFTARKPSKGLRRYESALYEKMFDGRTSVTLSELKNTFFETIQQVQGDLYDSLARQGYFAANPSRVRTTYAVLGVLAVAAALFLAWAAQNYMVGRTFVTPLIVAGVVLVPAVLLTSRVMPRRTRKGRIAWEQIQGIKEFIERAEVDDLKLQERQNVFERLLPYAVAFGLTTRWSKAFEGLYKTPPDWYHPAGDGPFTMVYFGSSLDNSIGSMNTALASQPAPQGGTGGDTGWSGGGFSGGGSAGGGFGGGGGGAW